MLHLAGHAKRERGFIWNANDAATASKTFDVDELSCTIGEVAGQKGPLECVVLNACSTERMMGRLLRQRGVPCVLCWKTPVRDETAIKLCERFYRPLVKSKGGV
jgi:CHAT domain-containing protein